ncbi:MAG: molecular chaperone DnaJ [Coriobacteriales bacterium]|nr:molecular chaperone DnaJ [Coriobacteriales bacterium]
MATDYYKTLEVAKDATDAEIKRAFYRKARELHPDVNKAPDAEERFKELNEAYDVLSDANKRAQYDRFGTVGGYGSGPGGYQYVDLDDLFGSGFGMGDIFSQFFGGSAYGRANVRREGRDMGVGLKLTLEEVATGTKKEIVYDRLAPCETCGGTGVGEGGQTVDCKRCNGTGRIVSVQRTFLGDMQTQATCPECGGTGKTIDIPCPDCEGQGRLPDRQHITIDVPHGIKDGQQLRLSGYGEAGMHGAAAGNLIVTVRIEQHPEFKRDGDNLHIRKQISITQAALGARIEVKGIMPEETVPVEIPEGCQNDQVVRVRNYGLPRFKRDSRGDLYVLVNVVVPRNLTKRQKELLEELSGEFGDSLGGKKTVGERIKDALS